MAIAQSPEYATFLRDKFDANAWTNDLLSGQTAVTSPLLASLTAGDVSAALTKLNSGIDSANTALRSEITANHSDLLSQVAAISTLDDALSKLRSGLKEVDNGVDRLRKKIALPHAHLSSALNRLDKLQKASDLTSRAARLVQLTRRLDAQMLELNAAKTEPTARGTKDRALAEAALTLSELDTLQPNPSDDAADQDPTNLLRQIKSLEPNFRSAAAAKDRVTMEMEDMLREGLTELNQEILASSLQTAANLGILASVVAALVTDLTQAMESRICTTFDMAALGREIAAKEPASTGTFAYKSRTRTEPTIASLPQWQALFWARSERLIQDMAECCTKVYTLEKVLKIKMDPVTQLTFFDSCMDVLQQKPTFTFWTTLSQTFEAQCKEMLRTSSFAQQTLSQAYTRLLRLFQEFFTTISVYTDTVYTATHQSPETVLLLRAVLPFEALYLARSKNRCNEAVSQATAGGVRQPPGTNEGVAAARVICNELDAARFDPLLVRSVARNAAKAIELFENRVKALVATDGGSVSQARNSELASSLYHFWELLDRFQRAGFNETSGVPDILGLPISRVKASYIAASAET